MQAIFYHNHSGTHVVNKKLTGAITYDIILKNEEDVVNPSILITDSRNLSGINYCYIEKLQRYYYVDNNKIPINLILIEQILVKWLFLIVMSLELFVLL